MQLWVVLLCALYLSLSVFGIFLVLISIHPVSDLESKNWTCNDEHA